MIYYYSLLYRMNSSHCVPSLIGAKRANVLLNRALTFAIYKSERARSDRSLRRVREESKWNSSATILSKIIMNDFIIFELSNKTIIISLYKCFSEYSKRGFFLQLTQ
jgi:hypothetical protein